MTRRRWYYDLTLAVGLACALVASGCIATAADVVADEVATAADAADAAVAEADAAAAAADVAVAEADVVAAAGDSLDDLGIERGAVCVELWWISGTISAENGEDGSEDFPASAAELGARIMEGLEYGEVTVEVMENLCEVMFATADLVCLIGEDGLTPQNRRLWEVAC